LIVEARAPGARLYALESFNSSVNGGSMDVMARMDRMDRVLRDIAVVLIDMASFSVDGAENSAAASKPLLN